MTYLIWKVKASTGEAVRVMPILFSSQEQANVEAAALNSRLDAKARGYKYVTRAAQPNVIRSVSHAERILESG